MIHWYFSSLLRNEGINGGAKLDLGYANGMSEWVQICCINFLPSPCTPHLSAARIQIEYVENKDLTLGTGHVVWDGAINLARFIGAT